MRVLGQDYPPEFILFALVKESCSPGLGAFVAAMGPRITMELCKDELKRLFDRAGVAYVDYFHGRVVKTSFCGAPSFQYDFRLYDRDNGQGAAEAAILKWLDILTEPEGIKQ